MKPNELDQMLEQVQRMQSEMLEAQQALAEETVEGSAGGGMVKAVMTGSGDLKSIAISPDVVDPSDVEMLQDLVVAAVSDADRKARDRQAERLGSATDGLDLGGGGGLDGLLGSG